MSSPQISFEFFPPKTAEGTEKLHVTRARLSLLKPKFMSVTFGASGSTQQGTFDTALEIVSDGFDAVPHLSCIGASKQSLRGILAQYHAHGIQHIVALRGDLPPGMKKVGELHYACELVAFVRAEYGNWFHIEVAAYPEYHPQAKSPRADLENFVRKVKAGANSAITQYFYNADAYFRFVNDVHKLGVDIPITPGVMPITNYTQLMRFSAMCGAEVPKWIARRLESFGDDRDAIQAFGLDVVTAMCERLIMNGAPGLHFYTLNSAVESKTICERLNI
ncbi:methylenetetrahydrofolate reductase [NAD(P)H] [Candidatus Vallotia lariciata]|uniref:methylenetetrahydrofolate reductase [NAD(P)H] n=1 Tax=Candidatus Vallotia laricis TaxID=2018052 RepID=UPI001D023EEF|nr:methylenetetrahydrofolate reductase [NAD(P)H] [Candidatus Vallotia lariciata]UDG83353.1 5,10-methylenetetrahydrofolate reductase [Candidatus Vallotia lariciata]